MCVLPPAQSMMHSADSAINKANAWHETAMRSREQQGTPRANVAAGCLSVTARQYALHVLPVSSC